jgi:hypothetical protein
MFISLFSNPEPRTPWFFCEPQTPNPETRFQSFRNLSINASIFSGVRFS